MVRAVFLNKCKDHCKKCNNFENKLNWAATGGGFCSSLEHGGRRLFTVLTVTVHSILGLQRVNAEGEVSPSPTATELVRHVRGFFTDQEFGGCPGICWYQYTRIVSPSYSSVYSTLWLPLQHMVAFCPGDTDTEDGDWEIKMSPLDPEVINTHWL